MNLNSKFTIPIVLILYSASFAMAQINWDTLQLQNKISPNYTQDIQYDTQNYLWISTARGLYRIDGYEARYYVHNPEDTLSLANNIVTKVYEDHDGLLWILTDKGVQYYDHQSETFHSVLNDYIELQRDSLFKYGFQNAIQVSKTNMLLGTKDGCVLFDKLNHSYQYIPILSNTSTNGYSSLAHIVDIASSPIDSSTVYLLTKSGIYQYLNSSQTIELLNNDSRIEFSTIGPPGMSFLASEEYLYFIIRNEVYSYNLATQEYQPVGMPSVSDEKILIRDILISKDNRLIISTVNQGIYEASLFPPHAPIQIIDGKYNQLTISPEGKLVTIAETQHVVITQEEIGQNTELLPSLNIDKLWVNQNRINIRNVYNEDVYHLRDYERNLDIQISAIHSNPKASFHYYYQLDDLEWQSLKNERVLKYYDISPGEHRITFKTTYNEIEILSHPLYLKLDKYFYEQLWFKILILSTVFFTIATIYYLWGSIKRNREKHNKQLLEMELNALRSQMNPHFLFNTLNSIKNYVLTKTPDEAAYYLTKFSQLIRSILENSKVPFLTLKQELDSIKLYIEMEHLRFGGEFDYQINVDDKIDLLGFKVAPLLIQPFIENAIWHGLMNIKSNRKLLISFKVEGQGVTCIIEDNGIGLTESKKIQSKRNQHKKSLGLEITLERIKNINILHNIQAHVEISDREPNGTKVVLNLPNLDV